MAPLNTTTSVVDLLKSKGLPSDSGSRSQLYEKLGLGTQSDFMAGIGTGATNVKLLDYLSSNPKVLDTLAGSLQGIGNIKTEAPPAAPVKTDNAVGAAGGKLPGTVDEINKYQYSATGTTPPATTPPAGGIPDTGAAKTGTIPTGAGSYVSLFDTVRQKSGLTDLEDQAVKLKTTMGQVEADIRAEAARSGTPVTESYIQAQVAERNKPLTLQYQAIQDAITNKTKYVTDVMKLTGDERSDALNQINTYYKYGSQVPKDVWEKAGFVGEPPVVDKNRKWTVIGKDDTGTSIYGFVDTSTGTVDVQPTIGGSPFVAGSGYDIGSYATDPKHEANVGYIYNTIGAVNGPTDAQNYIKSIAPNSPVTGQMVMASSTKYGVDPAMVMALIQQDSQFGTQGKAVKTKNPGNVGNTDDGKTQTFGSWNEGVDAVAKWLSNHRATGGSAADSIITQRIEDPQNKQMWANASPTLKQYAKDLASGKKLLTSLPNRANIRAMASSLAGIIDPSYSDSTNIARNSYYQKFIAGTWSDNRQSINAAVGHLAELQKAASELKNVSFGGIFGIGSKVYNDVGTLIREQSQDPRVSRFNTVLNKYAAEVAKVYKGNASPTEDEIRQERETLVASMTMDQINEVAKTSADLLTSKLNAVRDDFKNVMGRDVPFNLIEQSAREKIKGMKDEKGNVLVDVDTIDPLVNQKVDYKGTLDALAK